MPCNLNSPAAKLIPPKPNTRISATIDRLRASVKSSPDFIKVCKPMTMIAPNSSSMIPPMTGAGTVCNSAPSLPINASAIAKIAAQVIIAGLKTRVKATAPVLNPARKLIPGIGGIDLATIIVIVLFIAIKIFIIAFLSGYSPTIIALILSGIRDFITLALNIFIFAIIIHAVLSWINPDPYNPVSSLLFSITRPVLEPFRRLIKPVGGLDLSPLVALIALMFIERLVVYLFNML